MQCNMIIVTEENGVLIVAKEIEIERGSRESSGKYFGGNQHISRLCIMSSVPAYNLRAHALPPARHERVLEPCL